MLNFRILGAVCGLVVFAATSAQAVTVYECNLKSKSGTWISPQIVIGHDRAKGKAFVHDPVIYYFNDKKPIDAKIEVENSKRIDFSWTVKGTKASDGQLALRMEYKGIYLKKPKKFVLTASPAGYGNSFRGEGKCKITER